ncbi:MAG: TetR/AcrR family transcriptional regulator [Desulfocucumaceae bacterium]
MTRNKRTDVEIEQVKSSILNAALYLFDTQDFNQVSMRKIADLAKCSAATIYNYYPNKDALYIDVLKSGFTLLYQRLLDDKPASHPDNTVKALTGRFFRFAADHKNYYELMFSYPVPKYLDYVGTAMEEAAAEEKEAGLVVLDAMSKVISKAMDQGEIKDTEDPGELAIMLWIICHGVISLHHSRVLQEVTPDSEKTYERAVSRFIESISVKKN